MRNDRILRRIATLQSVIRPAEGIIDRIEQLLPNDRRIYEEWRVARVGWIGSFSEPSSAYKSFLDGNEGPKLPLHIDIAIYGSRERFDKSMTLSDIMYAYEGLK